jgi:GNAT superfamily N-acetyltransferase
VTVPGDLPTRDELLALYAAVGWTAYTRDPDALLAAVRGSTWVRCERRAGALVGLARVVSDDVSIAWLQDLLVHPDHQRTGLGRALARAALERFDHVRTFALLTDDEPRQRAFYESVGLVALPDAAGGRLRSFVRLH